MKLETLKRYMIAKTLWRMACEFDAINADLNPMLVIFSDVNPWAIKLGAFERDESDVIGFPRGN